MLMGAQNVKKLQLQESQSLVYCSSCLVHLKQINLKKNFIQDVTELDISKLEKELRMWPTIVGLQNIALISFKILISKVVFKAFKTK